MAVNITWYGHNCWLIETSGTKILLDPFFSDSPTAPIEADEAACDFMLVSHGHFDHISDAVPIAQRTGCPLITVVEVAEWLKGQGVSEEQLVSLNLGGGQDFDFGRVKLTLAHHSSSLPDGSYGGNPAGFLLELAGKRLYFACDTALFLDMKLIGSGGLDLAVLPIGDKFTMGPDDSIEATKLLAPKNVLPCHYNTWPPIEQDAPAWAERIRHHTAAEPVLLKPGESFEV